MNEEMLRAAFGIQEITRYHMIQTAQAQSVADHSFKVGAIAAYLATDIGMCPMTAMYWGCLHDVDEFITGDIPTHVKIALKRKGVNPSELSRLPQVPAEYKWVVKAADYMEAIIWLGKNYKSKRSMDVYNYIHNNFNHWMAALPSQDGAAVRKVFEHLKKMDKYDVDYDLKWSDEEIAIHVGE